MLKIEEKKNLKKAVIYAFLTTLTIILFILFGLPTLAKFAALLTDLKSTSLAPEVADTIPPPPPKFNSLPSFTNQEKIEIKGSTEAGVVIYLFINREKNEILSNNQGEFSYTFYLKEGENTISALVRDSAANESVKTQDLKIILDKKPPILNITSPSEGSNFYGPKERQIVIKGETEEDSSVNINGRFVVVESDGSFAFATTLEQGENSFKIIAKDAADNKSESLLRISFTP
ncbi:hypothetical protein A2686_04725 [Candidatus Woesebacteria bacterium RIFCSPHIGHO2_01_FULL_38_10]|uniref:Uncharacterized protein n=1 Tax=Candidatus Woesebacteria bacterium RIFCSPLOWO2_01_FULL_39_10b TaxID=1802517 RepID=A0A1F8B699_9BACT|nr:MAG: hypothetical protein A2686_04725 [Candidatus Woesebacteria bacterium RIFCSPHIGHO2_01_FULL_38_10]OGM59440.1 MAG: hypothetical protein A2892_02205 [Candidatus Woesebacteria bacterium RIFCSPLOWO2_01_FULL_39_10b]